MLYIRVITLFQKAPTYKWIVDFIKFFNAWILDIILLKTAVHACQYKVTYPGKIPCLHSN